MIGPVILAVAVSFLVLGIAYKYRGRRLEAAEKKLREARYREEAAGIQDEIKELERKARESNTHADNLLSDYLERFPPTREWRPGSGDKPDKSN